MQKSILTEFFRKVKHVFNNVLIMNLGHVSYLTAKTSKAEYAMLFGKVAKCKQSSILNSILNTNSLSLY
jgi:hypothetical protein